MGQYIEAAKRPEGMKVALNNCSSNMNMYTMDETPTYGANEMKKGGKARFDMTIPHRLQRAMDEFAATYQAMMTQLTDGTEFNHSRIEEYARFIMDLAGR